MINHIYILLFHRRDLNDETEKELSHFFRSRPKQPYTFLTQTDGVAVGKYTPKYEYVTAQVK